MKQPSDFEPGGTPSPASASPGCPPVEAWEGLCAGTLPEDVAIAHLRHAATCSDCSDRLAVATHDAPGADLATPEDEAFLASLSTATPEGRQRLAARLALEVDRQSPAAFVLPTAPHPPAAQKLALVPARPLPRRLLWTAALAATLALVGFVTYRAFAPPSDAKLLALAYDAHRTSELRLPGSHAVALASPTRGAASADDGTDMLALKMSTRRKADANPNDPAVRQAQGEIALVEHDAESARRDFEMAEALNPALPRLKFDLASAYFELAESGTHPLDYARAIDLYSQYLQQSAPNDPVALFNRGLCWQRQSVNSQALADFQAALQYEKDDAWRAEIQRHIDRLKAQSAISNPTGPGPPLTPAALLATQQEAPGDFETYLDLAGREWLPHRFDAPLPQRPQLEAALQKLADLGASAHQDLWLRDMLAAPDTPILRAATAALAQALTANAKGSVDPALAAAQSAAKLFAQAGFQPGLLRAQADILYDFERASRGPECLAQAQAVQSNPTLSRYTWISTYVLLEVGSCHGILGQPAVSIADDYRSQLFAASHHLDIIALRAAGFAAEGEQMFDHVHAAWGISTQTLAASYPVRNSSARRYQVFYVMGRAANRLDLAWTREEVAAASAAEATHTVNTQLTAYAFERLGIEQTNVNAFSDAEHSFATADRYLAQVPDSPIKQHYLSSWAIDRLRFQLQRGRDPRTLLQTVEKQEAFYQQPERIEEVLRFYTLYAELLRRTNHPDRATNAIWKAVQASEQSLAKADSESKVSIWQTNASPPYRLLVQLLAESGNPTAAAQAWQWYRSSAVRKPLPSSSAQDSRHGIASLPAIPPPPAHTVNLVYARMDDRYLGWALSADPAQPPAMHFLPGIAADIDRRVSIFRQLCADPTSSPQDLATIGAALDRDLIQPFAAAIDPAAAIQIDPDSALAWTPFAAIPHAGGYLGLQHRLSLLPAGWTAHPPHPVGDKSAPDADTLPANSRMLLVRQSKSATSAVIPDGYDETQELARRFSQSHLVDATLNRSGTDLTSNAGPAFKTLLATSDIVHYTGHGLDEVPGPAPEPTTTFTSIAPNSLLRCRLAVLAACHTLGSHSGKRDAVADDVPSFARLFFKAGARRVLATEWDVDSAATQQLMVAFYTELANHQPFTEALRRAQSSTRSNPRFAHPYYWAAFQLVGQPMPPPEKP
jgi:CHAT domain-containing protein